MYSLTIHPKENTLENLSVLELNCIAVDEMTGLEVLASTL